MPLWLRCEYMTHWHQTKYSKCQWWHSLQSHLDAHVLWDLIASMSCLLIWLVTISFNKDTYTHSSLSAKLIASLVGGGGFNESSALTSYIVSIWVSYATSNTCQSREAKGWCQLLMAGCRMPQYLSIGNAHESCCKDAWSNVNKSMQSKRTDGNTLWIVLIVVSKTQVNQAAKKRGK